MSTPNPWVVSALEELGALEQRHAEHGLNAAQAYRVRVLLARLEQARAAKLEVEVPEALRELGARIAQKAEAPSPTALLARLEETLAQDEDPFGELLGVLLQVDDAVSVGETAGLPEATELARLADAHASLEPERLGALGTMAERRLSTLPSGAAIRALWKTVARSAVDAALDVMPPPPDMPESLTRRRLAGRLQARRGDALHEDVSTAPLLEKLLAPAAAELQGPLEPFEQGGVGLHEENGELYLQVLLPPGRAPAGNIELYVSVGGRTVMVPVHIRERSRRIVNAQLGSREQLRERLRAEGLPTTLEGARFEVVLAFEEAGDGR
ncbi:MAG TPA: hypothetical protein VEY88_05175 [Archangium sp.]|nr:hypothetical protein [Archangium sp.]